MVQKYTLQFPFEFEGKKIEQVAITRLKVKHLKQLDMKDPDYLLHMLSLSLGLPLEACDEIDLVDFIAIQKECGGDGAFLEGMTS